MKILMMFNGAYVTAQDDYPINLWSKRAMKDNGNIAAWAGQNCLRTSGLGKHWTNFQICKW